MAVDDMKDDDASPAPKAKAKKPIVKILLIVVGALVAIGLTVAATLFAAGGMSAGQKSEPPSATKSEDGENTEKPSTESSEPGSTSKALYFAFDPPFVVNFEDQATMRFLQIGLEVMAKNPSAITAIQEHMPVIKNSLILLFTSQDYQSISTREGKERIRAQTLSEIQKILKEKTGDVGIEAVYFTSFVMQ